MHSKELYRFKVLFFVVVVFALYGTLGFMTIENLSFTDALLRTILIFSTLGFSEATTQTLVGKWFTIILAVGGVSVIVYAASTFMKAVIEGNISGSWKKHMRDKQIHKLKDHIIVCGFGQVGRQIAEEVAAEGVPVLVIDLQDKSEVCHEAGYIFMQGNGAASDEVWQKANLSQAKALLLAMSNDSECLAAAVTARAVSPDVFIVARATTKQAEGRLYRIGVNRVALPALIGGYHMATMALRPSVIDFLDVLISNKHDDLQIEELLVEENSPHIGKKVVEALGKKRSGVVPLALYRRNSADFIRPDNDTEINVGDKIILMGLPKQLEKVMEPA